MSTTEKIEIPPVLGKPEDLFKRFAKKDPAQETKQEVKEELETEEIQQTTEEKGLKDVQGKKTSFTKHKILEAEALRKEKEEIQKKLEEYEKTKLPEYETKIADLEKRLEESVSATKSNQIESELTKLKADRDEMETRYSKELEELRDKVSFFDLTQNPNFQKEYVAPMAELYQEAQYILNGEQSYLTDLDKALYANTAALQAINPQERKKQEDMRDEVLNAIYEQLPPIKQANFLNTVQNLIIKSRKHAAALSNHQQTLKEVEENNKRTYQEQMLKTKNRWKGAGTQNWDKISQEIAYGDGIENIIKSNKINDDVSADERIAQAIIEDGGTAYEPEEVTRIIKQGQAYPKLLAQIKAYQIKEKEYQETISRMRGSSSSGESSQTATSSVEKKKNDFSTFLSRFQPTH